MSEYKRHATRRARMGVGTASFSTRPLIPPERLAEIKSRVTFPSLVAQRILIKRSGRDFVALCPFHNERSPSFRIYRDHGHCFGCGWHGDQIRWLLDLDGVGFLGAVCALCELSGIGEPSVTDLDLRREFACGWHPIVPVPDEAPRFRAGQAARVFNPKREGEDRAWSNWLPAMVHEYRGETGELLGYVLRIEPNSGRKVTPTVTYCENVGGQRRWCLLPFPRPAPLYRLDQVSARPDAIVLLVEGEKTADAAQRLFPSSIAATWAGGSNAHRQADFAPLRGRCVVCVPDADQPGREAFHGHRSRSGKWVPGIVEALRAIGASVQLAEPEPTRPQGWDLADAESEGWSVAAALSWFDSRVAEARHAA